MRPVAPRMHPDAPEQTLAENQLQLRPIVMATLTHPAGDQSWVTRWTFTSAEREAVAQGADIYVGQPAHEGLFTPLNVGLLDAFIDFTEVTP